MKRLCHYIECKIYIPENIRPNLLEVELRVGAIHDMFVVGDIEKIEPNEHLLGWISPPLERRKALSHPQPLQHGNIHSSHMSTWQ
jgi:hypothetical protein